MRPLCTLISSISSHLQGGIKAVVYTDVLQTLLMYIGTLVVTIISVVDVGGVAKVWNTAELGGRIEFFK